MSIFVGTLSFQIAGATCTAFLENASQFTTNGSFAYCTVTLCQGLSVLHLSQIRRSHWLSAGQRFKSQISIGFSFVDSPLTSTTFTGLLWKLAESEGGESFPASSLETAPAKGWQQDWPEGRVGLQQSLSEGLDCESGTSLQSQGSGLSLCRPGASITGCGLTPEAGRLLGPDSWRGLAAASCPLAKLPAAQGVSASLLNRDLGGASQRSRQRVTTKWRTVHTKTDPVYQVQRLTERIPKRVLEEGESGIQKKGRGCPKHSVWSIYLTCG